MSVAVGGRRVDVLVDGTTPLDEGVEAIRYAVQGGRSARVVVYGGGGRSRIGTILARRELLAREIGVDVRASWIKPDRDPPIQFWAQKLGIELA